MNQAFVVDNGECGSTDLIQTNIDTGGMEPRKQPQGESPLLQDK